MTRSIPAPAGRWPAAPRRTAGGRWSPRSAAGERPGSRGSACRSPGASAQDKLARMSGPPPVTGISELVLEVSDLEAARHFYRDVLGFEETLYGEGREGRYWYLIGDSARLGLWTEQV